VGQLAVGAVDVPEAVEQLDDGIDLADMGREPPGNNGSAITLPVSFSLRSP
jgi:hypothetical protein